MKRSTNKKLNMWDNLYISIGSALSYTVVIFVVFYVANFTVELFNRMLFPVSHFFNKVVDIFSMLVNW